MQPEDLKPSSQNIASLKTWTLRLIAPSFAHKKGEAVRSAAHLVALRRERIGEHSVEDAWQLPDFVAAIQREREALGLAPGVPISEAQVPAAEREQEPAAVEV